MELRCAYLAVLMGLLCGPALGVDHVVVLDDPDMFGAGWWTAVSGPDMDNGSAWLLQLGEWQQVGTLNLSSLFGISAMPRIDDWSWFGMKINRGDNAVGGYFDLYTLPGSDPLLTDDDGHHQRQLRTMPDAHDNYSEHLPGGMYDEDDWGWRSSDGRDPNGVALRPDGTTSEPIEFWAPPHTGEHATRPDLMEIQNATYSDLWDNSGWPESWQAPNDATTWNYGEQRIFEMTMRSAWSTAGTAGIDTFRWEMTNGDTYTIHFDAPGGAGQSVPLPGAGVSGAITLVVIGARRRRWSLVSTGQRYANRREV